MQEASDWTEFQVMIESWELMPTLDERIELRWIMGGRDDASYLSVRRLLLLYHDEAG